VEVDFENFVAGGRGVGAGFEGPEGRFGLGRESVNLYGWQVTLVSTRLTRFFCLCVTIAIE